MSRRPAWTTALLLGLMALVLSACVAPAAPAAPAASDGAAASSDAAAIELVVWAEGGTVNTIESDPEGQGKYGKYIIEKFEEENPGVKVKLEYHGWDEELRQNLVTALLANNAPDIVVGENFFQQYAELGTLQSPAGNK